MTPDATFNILKESLTVLFAISMPLLLVGLAIGVAISLVQAATQVQEASLVFVPKLVAVAMTFWAMAPWIGEKMISFCQEVFTQIAQAGMVGGAGL